MAPRGASPAPTPLPKVSFVKVEDDYSKHPKGVHDQQARSYGYNEVNAEFQRPDHYIRYIEPLESDLAVQVEYDMDEQDQAWLDAVNTERKKEHIDKITYETFEIVMDRLEKEWFDLTKNIPKSDFALPSEDSTCAICDDSEGENTNAIVFCDGCNLAVHQDCYGVPYIPEGQWLCRKCTVFPESPVSCILCPNEGGAFKQTVQGEWVHLLCAIWVPETRVANEVFMEPVTGVERISKQRWKLKCDVCGVREGACIQCNKTSCFLAFHATCARKERLLMPMKATQGSEAPTLSCYCEKHLPKEQADIRAAALEAEQNAAEDDEDVENGGTKSPKLSKTARAYAKTYKPGPPIVPHIIVRRILQYISKINIRHKEKFVLLVCKYWSLKREVRRGAPLLKRLHLEPWTANSGGRAHTDEDKAIKLEVLKRLRDDLERVRVLTHTTRKREKYKLRQVEAIRDVLSLIVSPHEAPLRMAFERIMVADRQDFFKNPVSKFDVPDYYDVIKNPMCWSNIDQKLDAHEYWDLKDFKDDVNLVLSNAMTYNKKATTFYKAAERIQNAANTILADLEEKLLQKRPEADPLPAAEASTPPAEEAESELGTLEPPLPLLELLAVEDSIKDGTKLVLSGSPLTSLFSFELPVFKPPPPPPPPKSKKPTRSEILVAKRRQRKADLDSSPGFRAPRTRNARAQAAAFEAEATGAGTSSPVQVAASLEEPEPSLEEEGTRRRHKPKAVLPGQTEEVPLMDDVDDQDSFKLFNDGWVLPPDRKRHNRPPVEKKPAPPPRKRHRAEREKSHLSTFSTSALENETLQTPSVSALDLPDTGVQPAAQAAPFKPPQSDARNALVPQNDETDNMEVDVVGLPEAGPSHISDHEAGIDVDDLPEVAPALVPSPHPDYDLDIEMHTDPGPHQPTPPPAATVAQHSGETEMSIEMDVDEPPAMDQPVFIESTEPSEPAETILAEASEPADVMKQHPSTEDVVAILCERSLSVEPGEPEEHFVDIESAEPDASSAPAGLATLAEPDDTAEVASDSTELMELPIQTEQPVESDRGDPVQPDKQEVPIEPSESGHVPIPESEVAVKEEEEADEDHAAVQEEEEEEEENEIEADGQKGDVEVETEDLKEDQEEDQAEEGDNDEQMENMEEEEDEKEEEERDDEQKNEESADEEEDDDEPPKIIIIETLDTPETRREKNRQRKEERLRLREAVERMTGPPTEDAEAEEDAQSELSALSEISDDGMNEEAEVEPPEPEEPKELGEVQVQEDGSIEGGTLVWAKIKSWPWWPAVVYERDDAEIPKKILKQMGKYEQNTQKRLYLVRFFDKKRNWQWLESNKLLELGEHDELDQDMMASNSKRQRWRNGNDRAACRAAWREAKEEMEMGPERENTMSES